VNVVGPMVGPWWPIVWRQLGSFVTEGNDLASLCVWVLEMAGPAVGQLSNFPCGLKPWYTVRSCFCAQFPSCPFSSLLLARRRLCFSAFLHF
jgi:hypothetical protein